MARLKARGAAGASPTGSPARTPQRPRPYAVHKPREYQGHPPGDLVQVDTLRQAAHLRRVALKLTARDVVEAHSRVTATSAVASLDTPQARIPHPVNALQVDGGSELQVAFEEACQQRGSGSSC